MRLPLLGVALFLSGCQLFLSSLTEGGNCRDSLDNDNDGAIDCADAACQTAPECIILSTDCNLETGTLNLNTQTCVGSPTPDGLSLPVVGGVTAGATSLPFSSTAGFFPGDSVLLINLQGSPGGTSGVGVHELLRVASITPTSVTFEAPIVNNYPGSDRIVLQRVPRYTTVRLGQQAQITANAWDGAQGGVVAFEAEQVFLDGTITASGLGYRGGARPLNSQAPGFVGETIDGVVTQTLDSLFSGGGGENQCGAANGSAGAGGGSATPGEDSSIGSCARGGEAYAVSPNRAFLGSGGGSGGNDNSLTDNPLGGLGGSGGGLIFIRANIDVGPTGAILAVGQDGQGDPSSGCFGSSTTDCFDFSGPGGAGAGGSVFLFGNITDPTAINVSGGKGGFGGAAGNGGKGGDGTVLRQ